MAMDTADAPQMIEHIRQSVTFTPHDTKWIPCSARFISCGISPGGKGVLNMYELAHGTLNKKLECNALRPSGIKCATFGASRLEDRVVATGDYSGVLSMFDLERCIGSDNSNSNNNNSSSSSRSGSGDTTQQKENPAEVFSVQAHESIINCIDGIGGGGSATVGIGAPEIVTGGRDGVARIWDPRVDYPVVSLEPEKGVATRDCWTVSFGNAYNEEERCVLAGYDNGDLKLFDLRTHSVRWESNCNNGITCAEFDRKDIEMNKIVATTLESNFMCYDMRTQHCSDGFASLTEKAHRSTIWLARHLPQNRDIFMTGGGNGGFNIYKYHYPLKRVGKHKKDGSPIGVMGDVELLNSRVISTQPITSFDWSPDRGGLCCMGSLDQSLRMKYTATDGSVFNSRTEYRKYEMETQYTFREKDRVTLTKLPGSVSGQPFNIINCSNSTLAVLDHCDQVQIDDVKKSRIFIGASSESVFIRNCNGCTFTIACKQLRTRDCTNCTIYLYCKTKPIIESSKRMKFGHFNGAYPGHEKAMKDAKLIPKQNLWYSIYDFSDDLNTNHNWSYVKEEDEDRLWCPLGEAENCCPRVDLKRTKNNSFSSEESNVTFVDVDNDRSNVGMKTKNGGDDFKFNEITETKTAKSWIDLLKMYVHFPLQVKNLFIHSLDLATGWITSMKDSITSFFPIRE